MKQSRLPSQLQPQSVETSLASTEELEAVVEMQIATEVVRSWSPWDACPLCCWKLRLEPSQCLSWRLHQREFQVGWRQPEFVLEWGLCRASFVVGEAKE